MDNHVLEIDSVCFGFEAFVFYGKCSRHRVVKRLWGEQSCGNLTFRSHDRLFYVVETVAEILEIGMCVEIFFVRDTEMLAEHFEEQLVAILHTQWVSTVKYACAVSVVRNPVCFATIRLSSFDPFYHFETELCLSFISDGLSESVA